MRLFNMFKRTTTPTIELTVDDYNKMCNLIISLNDRLVKRAEDDIASHDKRENDNAEILQTLASLKAELAGRDEKIDTLKNMLSLKQATIDSLKKEAKEYQSKVTEMDRRISELVNSIENRNVALVNKDKVIKTQREMLNNPVDLPTKPHHGRVGKPVKITTDGKEFVHFDDIARAALWLGSDYKKVYKALFYERDIDGWRVYWEDADLQEEPVKVEEPKPSKRVILASTPLTNAKFYNVWMNKDKVHTFATQKKVAEFLGVSCATVSKTTKDNKKYKTNKTIKGYFVKEIEKPLGK